jgi:hypothetical protein
MPRKAIIAIFLVVAIFITALVVWKWVFKKSDVTMASKKADFEIESGVLLNEFEVNEDSANARFLEKIVIVTGTVNVINQEGQGYSVYLKNSSDVSGVMCSFNMTALDTNTIKKGDKVKIKGICSGYLMDVILNKCSVEK